MWDVSIFDNEFKIKSYGLGEFPFLNMFTNNSYYSMSESNLIKRTDRHLTDAFIKNRQNYILNICHSHTLCDKDDENSVFAYIFYRIDDVPVLYFAYVKKSFRAKGAMKYLLDKSLDVKSLDRIRVSYPFPLNKSILDKVGKSPFFI